MRNATITFLFLPLFFIGVGSKAQGQNPKIKLDTFASGYVNITDIANAGDDRLFITEQAGIIRTVSSDGMINDSIFLDITDRVRDRGNEQGLLGLTFHPDFQNNGFFYVNYTAAPDGSTYISRFSVNDEPPFLADPESEKVIFTQEQPFENHNAGDLNFGPDGYLYFGLGDGGAANDQLEVAQDGNSFLGKMIRIDVDSGDPYQIPPDNPFLNDTTVKDEIWSLGLRNPWRFSFDPLNGDMWIADVGQNQFEEVNLEKGSSDGGKNWGWDCYEGNQAFELRGCEEREFYDFPIFEYAHQRTHCSVTGGYIYRGARHPQLQGHYLLADLCSGYFWTVYKKENDDYDTTFQGKLTQRPITTFGKDHEGELYVAERSGVIYKVSAEPTSAIRGRVGALQSLNVLPNPITPESRLYMRLEKSSRVYMSISNLQAQVVWKDNHLFGEGDHFLELGSVFYGRQLPPGIYILQLRSKDQLMTSKVVFSP